MTQKMKDSIEEIDINTVLLSEWDVRKIKEDKNDEKFQSLVRSIQHNGLLNPLTILKVNDKYVLVAGRRRLRACKELGLKTVPIFIKNVPLEQQKTEIRKISVIENIQRLTLEDYERSYGIKDIYESAGYKLADAIAGVKSIDNWFSNNTNHKVDWDAFIHNSVVYRERLNTSPLRFDKKFIAICQSIGFAPKYQYQLLQLVRDIPEKTLIKADKANISTHAKIALTNTKLREHPKMQDAIVNEIAKKQDKNTIKEMVYQVASDLETGAIHKEGDSYTSYDSLRAKLSNDTELLPSQRGLRITMEAKKLIFELTQIPITKKQIRYESIVVEKSKNTMLETVKATGDSQLVSIYENLEVAKKAIEQMMNLINTEFDTRDMKKELEAR